MSTIFFYHQKFFIIFAIIKGKMNTNSECKNPWLCAALGFCLPLFGLIIGAIIGKGEGVKHALGGVVLRYVLFFGGCRWLFKQLPAASKSSALVESGKQAASESKTWEVLKETSPLDDSTTYTICREAESPVGGGFRKVPPVLVLRRKEGESEAYISWPLYLSRGKLPVTVRFDDDQAATEDWTCSTDGKAVFSPIPFGVFLGRVLDSRRLVVRLTPFGEKQETAIFDLSGLADVLDAETRAALNIGGM